jgi:hypothetical protein
MTKRKQKSIWRAFDEAHAAWKDAAKIGDAALKILRPVYDAFAPPRRRGEYNVEKRSAAEKVIKAIFPGGRPEGMPPAEFLRTIRGSDEFKKLPREQQSMNDKTIMRAAARLVERC